MFHYSVQHTESISSHSPDTHSHKLAKQAKSTNGHLFAYGAHHFKLVQMCIIYTRSWQAFHTNSRSPDVPSHKFILSRIEIAITQNTNLQYMVPAAAQELQVPYLWGSELG